MKTVASRLLAAFALCTVVIACRSDAPNVRADTGGEQVLAARLDLAERKAEPNSTNLSLPLRTDTAALEVPIALPGPEAETTTAPQAQRRRLDAAGPAPQSKPLSAEKWTELIALDPTFVLDLRYATANNFVGEPMYDCGRCYLRRDAALSLKRLQDSLRTLGLGFKLYDCYRPLSVQWRLWKKVPDRRYVADPRKGSQHNRGVAVDLTLVDLATGEELDMGTAYDFFGHEAWHAHTPKFSEPIRSNRERLRRLMTGLGWRETSSEWWHYSYRVPQPPISEEEWGCG